MLPYAFDYLYKRVGSIVVVVSPLIAKYWAIPFNAQTIHLMRRRREIFDFRSFLMLSNLSCSAKYFLIESKHLGHKYPDSYSLPDSFVLFVSIAKPIKTALQRCDIVLASCLLFCYLKPERRGGCRKFRRGGHHRGWVREGEARKF